MRVLHHGPLRPPPDGLDRWHPDLGAWRLEVRAEPRRLLPLETSVPGVFAVGDVRHGSIKRVASAVGEGSIAVQLTHDYLSER